MGSKTRPRATAEGRSIAWKNIKGDEGARRVISNHVPFDPPRMSSKKGRRHMVNRYPRGSSIAAQIQATTNARARRYPR